MENYSANPDLMRYLQGEISFDTWLEQQGNEDETENHHTQQRAGTTPSGRPHAMSQGVSEESASVFSSWGDAFTSGAASGGGGDEQMTLPGTSKQFFNNTSGGVVEEDSDYEEDDGTETEEEVLQIGKANKSEKAKRRLITFDLQMPSFEDLPTPLESEVPSTGALTITWQELRPIIKELAVIIPTSTINKRRSKMRHRRLTEDSTGDNVPDIMKDFQDFQLRKRDSKRTPPNHHKLPELLRLQMGQANLLVAKQDFKQAADICMEIVREAPYSGLPFKTLAFIYDEQGDKEMALQYSLIYAYLDCRDSHEWIEMGRRCREADNVKQEMACYDKACKYKPWDIELQWERSLKYFAYGDYRKCLDIYFQIHKRVTPVDKITYMSCGKRIAKLYHKLGLKDKVQYSLQLAFDACDTVEDFEAVNILCEIYIENKEFINAMELIIQQCGVKIPSFVYERIKAVTRGDSKRLDEFLSQSVEMTKEKFEERTNELASNVADTLKEGQETLNIMENFNTASPEKTYATLGPANENTTVETSEYYCPSNLPLDLRVKLAQCLIYSNQLDFVDDIVYPLFSESIDDVGDLVLDLGEAYYDIGNYREALKYIVEVIASEKYNQAAVWLKLAEVYEHLDEMNQCIDAYYQVLHLAPLQVSIRLALASALKIVGRDEEALTVLSEYDGTRLDEDGDEVECLSESNRLKVEEYQAWYDKCMSMYSNHQLKEFIFHGYILMHNYLMSSFGHQKKQTVSKVHMWEMLLKILNVSVKIKEFQKATTLLEKALLYKPYSESRKYRLDLDYLLTTTYFLAGDYSKAFDMFRVIMMHERNENINKNSIWNLFTQIVNKMLDKRHHRFSLRLLFKRPNHVPLIIQNGINSHLSGTYKYAIGEFSRAFREWPTYPLTSLLLGTAFIHLSCQKFHKTRHTSILHGLIFTFQYYHLRGGNQEACYNLARAFHSAGLIHFATHYYNKALDFPLHDEKKNEYNPFIDLHREAAYNLSNIYRNSGNKDLARNVLYKYCWI